MFENLSSFSRNARKHTALIALLCVIALAASACQMSPSNSLTPTQTRTPTEPVDYSSLDEPTATSTLPVPTELSGSGSGSADVSDDICKLLTQDEAEQALGQAVVSILPGVDEDSLTGQTTDFCTYRGQDLAVVVSVVDTGSLDSVQATIDQELKNQEEGDEVPTVIQVPGLGDLAYWTTTSHAGGYIVQIGTVVYSVSIGGNIGDPAAYQEAIQILASLVAQRL